MCRSYPYLYLESTKNFLPLLCSKGTGRSILYLVFYSRGCPNLLIANRGSDSTLGMWRTLSLYSKCTGCIFTKIAENTAVKLNPISPEELSNAVELLSLALFLRYKLKLRNERGNDLGVQMSCEANMKEPSEAPPHHLGCKIFYFKQGEIVYHYSCQKMIVKLLEVEHCYSDIPIHQVKKYKFLSIAKCIMITSSAKEPCVLHFPKFLHGIKSWIKIGSKLRSIPKPQRPDELGFYTAAEEQDFDHIAWLRYYLEQITSSIVHAVCRNDNCCDFNPLPGTQSFLLT